MHTDTHLGPKKNAQIKNEWKKSLQNLVTLKAEQAMMYFIYIYIKNCFKKQ
jgi:hypothetical protein